MLRTMVETPICLALIWCAASMPLRFGMVISSTAMSGLRSLRQIHRCAAVAGLSDHLEILLLLQNQPQSAPHHGVIVGQNNPDQATLSSSGLQRSFSSWKYVERIVPCPGCDWI